MASKKKKVRKKFTPSRRARSEREMYASFVAALLAGSIHPTQLIETKRGGRVVDLEFEEDEDA